MTYREMIERIAGCAASVRYRRGAGPDPAPLVALAPPGHAGQSGVARPLIEGLRNETVARDDRIRELVPLELTPFDAAVREALA